MHEFAVVSLQDCYKVLYGVYMKDSSMTLTQVVWIIMMMVSL